jgi:SAM-dependent methyltransferase
LLPDRSDPSEKQNPYTEEFFRHITEGAAASAAVVVPLVMSLIRPRSVVDVGCGTGAWLSAFRSAGVERIVGVDGDYVNRESLLIPGECFSAANLTEGVALDETFDLCMSLEVAEHLPASAAPGFVASLANLAPVVLFSAAVPGQTGAGHFNERWPDYWMALFAEHGYLQLDPFRHQLWHDARVAWWYRQNLFLYVDPRRSRQVGGDRDDLGARSNAGRALLLVHCEIVRRLEARAVEQEEALAHLRTGRGALRVLGLAATRVLRRWLRL